MPVVSIRHLTCYRYRNPVAFGEHRMMLRPLEAFDQRVLSHTLEVTPEPVLLREAHAASGATVGVARFDGRSDRLSFESRVRLVHQVTGGFDLEADAHGMGTDGLTYDGQDLPDLASSIVLRHPSDAADLRDWAGRFLRPVGRTRPSRLLSDMTQAIRQDFAYGLRLEGAPQTPSETLASRKGSCRDFAVLMMEAARSLGVAARFVSGYVYSGASTASRAGTGHTHAWVRAFVPGCGWTDFDPTNGIVGNADLIRVAVAVEPRQALPLHGTWSGLRSDYLGMDVKVEIEVETPSSAQRNAGLRVALA